VICAVPENRVVDLLRDERGEIDGDRLRTLADRLDVRENDYDAVLAALAEKGQTLRELIVQAASGSHQMILQLLST